MQPRGGRPPAPGPRCPKGPESEAIDTRAFRYVWGELEERDYAVDQLILTVPDPVRSRLALNFDRNLAAIQSAMGVAGFSLDRFDLPWRVEPEDGRAKDAEPESRFETEPGVILFQNVQARPRKLLLVFLVGETPTGGVHKLALRKALELAFAAQRRPKACAEAARPLVFRVLGPSFTGSAHSLSATLADWRQRRAVIFDVVTGSATKVDPEEFSPRDLLAQQGDRFRTAIGRDQPGRLLELPRAEQGRAALIPEPHPTFR